VGSGLNLRFPGQYADSESGLSYNYFRDYEAGTGRYVESDPIRLRGGVSTFGYVRARPLNLIDEKGLGSGIGAFWNCINGPRPTDCGGGGRPAGGEGRQGYGGASPFKPPVPQSQSDSGFVCQSFFCFSVGLFEVCNPLGPEGLQGAFSTPSVRAGFKKCCRKNCDRNKPSKGETGVGVGEFLGVSATEYDLCVSGGLGLSPPLQGSYGVGN